jgi:hypothetical protein
MSVDQHYDIAMTLVDMGELLAVLCQDGALDSPVVREYLISTGKLLLPRVERNKHDVRSPAMKRAMCAVS